MAAGTGRRSRWAVGAAAATASLATLGGLLALFMQAAPPYWVKPTPGVLQAQARCESMTARDARARCTEALVARVLQGPPEATVAQR